MRFDILHEDIYDFNRYFFNEILKEFWIQNILEVVSKFLISIFNYIEIKYIVESILRPKKVNGSEIFC